MLLYLMFILDRFVLARVLLCPKALARQLAPDPLLAADVLAADACLLAWKADDQVGHALPALPLEVLLHN